MAKIITINRKYIVMVVSVVMMCLIGFAGVSLVKNKEVSSVSNNETPEIKMLGVAVEPASVVKDLTYGSVSLKGSQVISSETFDIIITVQNLTARQMTNVPVELQVSLIGDETKKVISHGTLKTVEPGSVTRVAFRQIKALGDALGKSATAGQHLITFKIKPNPEGGVEQATEASFRFNVDSTVKVSTEENK